MGEKNQKSRREKFTLLEINKNANKGIISTLMGHNSKNLIKREFFSDLYLYQKKKQTFHSILWDLLDIFFFQNVQANGFYCVHRLVNITHHSCLIYSRR